MEKLQLMKIGENAGVVWRILHGNVYSWEDLLKNTGLNPLELASAIGWLAKENKITVSPQKGILYFETYNECYY